MSKYIRDGKIVDLVGFMEAWNQLVDLIHEAYFTANPGTKMNEKVRQMHKITHPDHWSHSSEKTEAEA